MAIAFYLTQHTAQILRGIHWMCKTMQSRKESMIPQLCKLNCEHNECTKSSVTKNENHETITQFGSSGFDGFYVRTLWAPLRPHVYRANVSLHSINKKKKYKKKIRSVQYTFCFVYICWLCFRFFFFCCCLFIYAVRVKAPCRHMNRFI